MVTERKNSIRNGYLEGLRKRKNLTQQQVGDLINTSPTVISMLESGKRKLTQRYAVRLSPVYEVSIDEILAGEDPNAPLSVDVTAGRKSVELLRVYDEVLPQSAHDAISAYIDHMVDFYTLHQDTAENLPAFPKLNRNRDGWSWGLRHLGRVLTYKGALIGVHYQRLNIHRAKKIRIGKDWHWQTQMFVMGQSGPVARDETYEGGASPVVTQMAKAVGFTSGIYPSEVFSQIPHFEWNTTSDVMFIFLRHSSESFICLQFSGEYTAREFMLTENIADEYMEEFGGTDWNYQGHTIDE